MDVAFRIKSKFLSTVTACLTSFTTSHTALQVDQAPGPSLQNIPMVAFLPVLLLFTLFISDRGHLSRKVFSEVALLYILAIRALLVISCGPWERYLTLLCLLSHLQSVHTSYDCDKDQMT